MEDEILENSDSRQENVETGVDYIEAIKEMKQNTVDKKLYNKLVEENKKLVKSLINGDSYEVAQEQKPKVDKDALRRELYSENSNLLDIDVVKKSLDLRDAILEETGYDTLLPHGTKITATQEDYDAADRFVKVMRSCLEFANGDNQLFINELQRHIVDANIRPKR